MKKFLLICSVLLIAGTTLIVQKNTLSPSREHEATGEENPLAHEQWEYNRLADPATGKIPSMALWNAYQQLVAEGKINSGPFYSQANSRDVNWQPVNDFFASIAITKITYDPNNTQTFYFCTGEGWYGLGMAIGAGVWKSTDGGQTWNQLASTANSNFNYCQDIDVHPITGDVYIATLSGGLMRSQDGGSTWHKVLFPSGNLNHSICDVEFTKNGGVFATTGIFQSGAIYYSDSGDSASWIKQTNGFPTSGIYRVELATAPSNDSIAYAVACNTTDYGIKGIYKTLDKGQTWTQLPTPGGNDTLFAHFQAWYDLILAVDPNDPNDVVGGGWKLWRSRDGGNTWMQISHGNPDSSAYQYVHVDQHAIVFRNSDTVYFGNDGGIWKCDNFSDSLPNIYERNYGYRVTQYYFGDIPPDSGNITVIGGTQDNGSPMIYKPSLSPAVYLTGYDGGFCAINQTDPSIMYTTKNSNGTFRKKNFGFDVADTITNPYLNDNLTQFINPMTLDKADEDILYMGSSQGVWRLKPASTAKDSDWVQASKPTSAISYLANSADQPHRLYIGKASTAKIYRLEDADTSTKTHGFIDCDPAGHLPAGSLGNPIACSCIYVCPGDVSHVFSTYSNYGIKNIWETKDVLDGSPLWISDDGDLPNIPVQCIFDHPTHPEVCYIGTDLGAFYTANLNGDSTVWLPCNNGLANVRVTSLTYRPSDNTITATTYGRGIYVGTVPLNGPDYSITWSERGPLDVGGRTRAIMIDPNDPSGQTVWVGGVSGGLWKTTNIDGISAVGIASVQQNDFDLNVFPNPVTSEGATISLSFPQATVASVFIYDEEGRIVQALWKNRNVAAGIFDLQWNAGNNVAQGVYYVAAMAGNKKLVKKIVVMR